MDYKIKTSLEEPPTDLELKPLPDNLEYVCLEEPSFLPVIISSQLSAQNKSKLIYVIKRHKKAFAWKTTYILSICPSLYKHKIQLLDDKKPVIQKQRRFSPNIQEVVKKEILKLLDIGIIILLPIVLGLVLFTVYQRKAEKCHLMVKEGIVLGHKVSDAGLEVDKAKINAEPQALPTNDARVVITFLKKLFCQFEMPKALISDRGSLEDITRKKGKLAPRFVGPFEITERIGLVAYRLRLPEELNGVHDTFHMSNLKKRLADPTLQIPLDEIQVDARLKFVEEPVEILEGEFKKLKPSRIAIVKVRWNSKQRPEFTWERKDQMKLKFPHLFSSNAS
ncbi:hypothetical protein Tco_0894483 [Tanacetum coccineum]|uniref:Tf2-1-like SH3-like domain-containing protein n=1 Tax=Tanacetum coccineum TaxID=301880 RepID=A0ABQ5CBV0_9ASTR